MRWSRLERAARRQVLPCFGRLEMAMASDPMSPPKTATLAQLLPWVSTEICQLVGGPNAWGRTLITLQWARAVGLPVGTGGSWDRQESRHGECCQGQAGLLGAGRSFPSPLGEPPVWVQPAISSFPACSGWQGMEGAGKAPASSTSNFPPGSTSNFPPGSTSKTCAPARFGSCCLQAPLCPQLSLLLVSYQGEVHLSQEPQSSSFPQRWTKSQYS